jgi:hypothetical protein
MTTTNTRAQFNKVSALIQNNQKSQAITLLKPILAHDPCNAEAWWLAAHASPTPDAAIEACRRLLALKPDCEPARRMIVEQQLKKAADLLQEAEATRVLDLVRPILAEQPDNVEALWLFARATPTSADAIAACQRIRVLQPDHGGAQHLITTKQQLMVSTLAMRQARRKPSRSRPWMVFGLVGIISLVVVGLLAIMFIKGDLFNLSLGGPSKVTKKLGSLASNSSRGAGILPDMSGGNNPGDNIQIIADTLPPDGQHDYEFTASANSFFLAMVIFPAVSGNPGEGVTLLGPNGQIVASGDAPGTSSKGTVFIQAELPANGTYTLRLRGIRGVAQGAYTVEMGVQAYSGPGLP